MKRLRLLALLGLTACSTTVGLDATPYASDPVCAQMLLATPGEIGGFERAKTTAQSTTAWEDGSSFRCGLEPPVVTGDRCITVNDVDWLSLDPTDERVPDNGGEGTWTFISYGRVPTIEIVLTTSAVGETAVTDVLGQFNPAATIVTADRACIDVTDYPLTNPDAG